MRGVTSHSCPCISGTGTGSFRAAIGIRADMTRHPFGILAPPRTPRGISAWFPRTWDSRGRATGYDRHCKPHTSHLTATQDASFRKPTTVILNSAFRGRRQNSPVQLHHARVGPEDKHGYPAIDWDVSDAPRLNARRRRQDPRRRPAGVSSGSPTSGGS